MKIETAALERGAPVRRIVFDDSPAPAGDKTAKAPSPYSPWAWAAALARYAVGHEPQQPESTTQEIETR